MSEPTPQPRVARFDFGALRDFGEPFRPVPTKKAAVEEAPPAPPPPPSYSQQELDAARQQGWAEGKREGLDEGRQQATSEDTRQTELLQQALSSLINQGQGLNENYTSRCDEYRQDTIKLAIAIARQVCLVTLSAHPEALFHTLVENSLPVLMRQPNVTATVHPDLEAKGRTLLEEAMRKAGYEGGIAVRVDNSLAPHDARLSWAEGSAETTQEELWLAIDQVLTSMTVTAGKTPAAAEPTLNEGEEDHGGQ